MAPSCTGGTGAKVGVHCSPATSSRWPEWTRELYVVLSEPNPPLRRKVRRMAQTLEPFAFDAVYGSFSGRGQIDTNGKQVVAASVARYIARISESWTK